nr:PTS system mannose/fructose/sorbose family transporter subunit IID [Thermosediminibacter oceani]
MPEGKKRLSKGDILKSYLLWFFFAQSNYNYERLQATAFAHAMIPVYCIIKMDRVAK